MMKKSLLLGLFVCLCAFAHGGATNDLVRINYNVNFTYQGYRYSYPIYIGGERDQIERFWPTGVEARGEKIHLPYYNIWSEAWRVSSNRTVRLVFDCANGVAQVYYDFGILGIGRSSFFPIANKVTRLGSFGEGSQGFGLNGRLYDVVVTACGNPWARVINGCDKRIVANNVALAPNESCIMALPYQFTMGDDDEYEFYDADTGEELEDLYIQDDPDLAEARPRLIFLHNGDIWIRNQSTTSNTNLLESLVYADIKSGVSTNQILFGKADKPVYSEFLYMTTNLQLKTWWDFSTSDWPQRPIAKINDETVCSSHTTSHIVAYTINVGDVPIDALGFAAVYFTMSMQPRSGAGGACTMRCWDSAVSDYASAPANHKAEVAAGTGVATFKLTINTNTGEWSLTAL